MFLIEQSGRRCADCGRVIAVRVCRGKACTATRKRLRRIEDVVKKHYARLDRLHDLGVLVMPGSIHDWKYPEVFGKATGDGNPAA